MSERDWDAGVLMNALSLALRDAGATGEDVLLEISESTPAVVGFTYKGVSYSLTLVATQ